ncbi:MAG: type VI secretion system contractile sheath large subunit [Actinomycetota bacterium]
MFPNNTDFESQFTFETAATPLPEQPPFHILLLGDWCGTGSQIALSERRPVVVDRDNFDKTMKRLNVALELDLKGDGKDLLSFQFSELDDFHPDNLFRQVSLFSELRDIRRRLSNSDSFNDAARQVRSWFHLVDENITANNEVQPVLDDTPPIDSSNLLDLILTQPSESAASVQPQKIDNTELGRLISKIVSPHLVKIDENEQSKLLAAVDEATGELMRKILHHPQFQALESAWRGLYFLVRRLETDVDLKLFIFDISKVDLTDSLKSINNLTDSVIYRWLIRETIEMPGAQPFAVICGNYTFGLDVEDVATLMRLGKLASAADAPFISHIQPEMFGIKSFAPNPIFSEIKFSESTTEGKLWTALRGVPESAFLGLSPMRVLARVPFGETTDSTETFSFEEFTDQIDHELYLWTNPSFVLSLLLAQSYRLYGWEMAQALKRDVEGLPMYIYRSDGETKTKPCAEIVLTENLSERFLEQGLMPLISFRDSDRVSLARFQAISSPLKKLNGRWNQ